jgi:hypothetical protein
MPEPQFKILIGSADWGSPLSSQPTFKTLEEAQEAAREYLERQRQVGGPGASLRAIIEETAADGSILKHSVD